MKKVLSFLLLFILLFSLTGCRTKEMSTSEFKKAMEEMKHNVYDATDQYGDYSYVKKIYVAEDKDKNYQIEFYALDSNAKAKAVFSKNRAKFEHEQEGVSSNFETNFGSINKYSTKYSGKYRVVSRVGKTVLYIDTESKYEEKIKAILKKIDY